MGAGLKEPAEKFKITQVLSHPEFGFTKSRLRGDALWEKNCLEEASVGTRTASYGLSMSSGDWHQAERQ